MHQDVLNSIDLYVGNGGTAVLALSAHEVSVWSDYTYLQTTRLCFFFLRLHLCRLFLLEPLDFPPMTHMYRNRQRHKVKMLAFAFMAGKNLSPTLYFLKTFVI